jgi:hypothetical protein
VSWTLTRDKGQPDQLVGALKANNSLQRLARHLFGCLAWQLDPQHHGILEKLWHKGGGRARACKDVTEHCKNDLCLFSYHERESALTIARSPCRPDDQS